LVLSASIIGVCVSAAKRAKHLSCENDEALLRVYSSNDSAERRFEASTLASIMRVLYGFRAISQSSLFDGSWAAASRLANGWLGQLLLLCSGVIAGPTVEKEERRSVSRADFPVWACSKSRVDLASRSRAS
jgi:hypothetical protein